jgi:hypothetical protein
VSCYCSYCTKKRNGYKGSMDYSRGDIGSVTWNRDKQNVENEKKRKEKE